MLAGVCDSLAIASRCWRNGALAQLGERLLCKHQVIGSIPIGSTMPAADMLVIEEKEFGFGRYGRPGLPRCLTL